MNFPADIIVDDVLSAAIMYTEKNAIVHRSERPNWGIILKYEGETLYLCRGKSIRSNFANMVIIPKGYTYDWQCTKAGHYMDIEFLSRQEAHEIFECPIANADAILRAFHRLKKTYEKKTPFSRFETLHELYGILALIFKREEAFGAADKNAAKLQPAIDYLTANWNAPLRNESLAALTGLSCDYFRKLFRKVHGKTPLEYGKCVRMQKAKELLYGDYGSIGDVAEILGYSGIYDFSRDFKKHVGIAPSKFILEGA